MGTYKTSAVMAAAFVGLFVGSARAQEVVVAKIPFPFVVNGEQLPAGQYQITDNGEGVLAIRGTDKNSSMFAIAPLAGGHDPAGHAPALVFTRHENVYRLSEVWESGDEGRELEPPSLVHKTGRVEMQPLGSDVPIVVVSASTK
jgi:hypothetical protein